MDKKKETFEELLKKFAKEHGKDIKDIDIEAMMKESEGAAQDIEEISKMITTNLMGWIERQPDKEGWMAKVMAGMSRGVCFMLAVFDSMQDEDCKLLPSDTFRMLFPFGMVVAGKEVAVIRKRAHDEFVKSNAN